MSTQFRPLEIPPGVVGKPTKAMRSSNWSSVNLMRWVEGQMGPVGGQAQYTYSFASRCKAIHGWYGLDNVYRIAYLCETNLYVDVGGVLTDISPTPALTPPPPSGSGGYGDSNYADGTYAYGTPPPITTIQAVDKVPDAWSLDNFGSILYAMTSPDGRLLMWDPAVGGHAVVQPASGTRGPVPNGRCFVVTPERFIIIFGSYNDGTVGGGGPRRFAWCDQENPGAWDYSNVTSQAGYLDIEPASWIITALNTRNGTLIWTSKKCLLCTFLGIPYVYNYVPLADACTPWSPQSMVNTSAMAVWMSQQGSFSFDGTSLYPIACLVRPWVDDDINLLTVREQACMVHVANYNEVWWFFPQNTQLYNTRCIIYNYKEGWWSQGQMSRSAGITASYSSHTIMADGTVAFQHEAGIVYPANVPLPWAETFDLNIFGGNLYTGAMLGGSRLTTIKQLIPDVSGDVTNLLYSLKYRISRSVVPDSNGNPIVAPEIQTPTKPVRSDGYVDLRTTGRDIRLRIELAGPKVLPVTVGQHLVDAIQRGDR